MLLLKVIAYAALAYAALIAWLYATQDRAMFFPDRQAYSRNDVGARGFSDFNVTTDDGLRLTGWYASARRDKPTVLFFHGNASTWQWRAADFHPVAARGYGVVLAGYRGYGGNPGKPSEEGFYRDAAAYYRALTENLKIPPSKIVLHGESLGTGVAVEMAARHGSVAALILEAPYTSIADIVRHHYPFVVAPQLLLKNKFENDKKIGTFNMPKLFILAGADTVIPPDLGRRLYDMAPPPRSLRVLDGADHNAIRRSGGMGAVLEFLDTL